MRRKHVDALFLGEDVVAPCEDGRAELRHEGDRRLFPHPGERRIGIGPERGDVDVKMRGVGHGGLCCGSKYVIAGLDPAIHPLPKIHFSRSMDTRVKPAYDDLDDWSANTHTVR